MRKLLEERSRADFEAMCQDEFQSRVMQILVSSSREFRLFSLEFFRNKIDLCRDNLSAVFLLTTAIKHSESPEEFSFMIETVRIHLRELMQQRYFKRVFVSYIDKALKGELDFIYEALSIENSLLEILQDKYQTYILVGLIKRKHTASLRLLSRFIRDRLLLMLKSKYFKFVLNELIACEDGEILEFIFQNMTRLQLSGVDQLISIQKEYFYSYCLSTIQLTLACDPAKTSYRLQKFLKVMDSVYGLLQDLSLARL